MKDKTVSVVLCTYNGECYLKEQLDSIVRQTYPIMELIVQDDCSTDGTIGIIKEYVSKYPWIHLYRNEFNIGFKDNFGSATTRATGDLVAFSDQDDIWIENHIQVLVDTIQDSVLACACSVLVNKYGVSLGFTTDEEKGFSFVPQDSIEKAYRIFYNCGFYMGHNMLVDSKWLKSALPIPSGSVYHDIWFSAFACMNGGINYSDTVISYYRQHGGNVTKNRRFSIFKELKMRHHFDFSSDRIVVYNAIIERARNLSPQASSFLKEWKWYYDHTQLRSYHLRCWWHRFSHYKQIYGTDNYKYFILRSIQYLLTPPFKRIN